MASDCSDNLRFLPVGLDVKGKPCLVVGGVPWAAATEGVQVSDDGGATFKGAGESDKHVDNHALWIDPADPRHILAGCDGGLYADQIGVTRCAVEQRAAEQERIADLERELKEREAAAAAAAPPSANKAPNGVSRIPRPGSPP